MTPHYEAGFVAVSIEYSGAGLSRSSLLFKEPTGREHQQDERPTKHGTSRVKEPQRVALTAALALAGGLGGIGERCQIYSGPVMFSVR